MSYRRSLTVLFRLGQLHQFLLFQCVHHVRQASLAALGRPEREADHRLPTVPKALLWLGRRGRVSPVGVDRAAFTALVVLGGGSKSGLKVRRLEEWEPFLF